MRRVRGDAVRLGGGLAQRVALSVVAAVLFALGSAAVASAATNYNHVGVFGASGAGNGQFASATMPQRMAVHEESGKLFVADRGNNRVQVFTPSAAGADFAFSFAVTNPVGMAIDPANGNLYVSTTTTILKFNPDDASDPTAYTADGTFVSPTIGAGVGQIGALQAGSAAYPAKGGIAIDPTDSSLVVADVGRNIVQRFNSNGGFVSSFNGCSPELFVGFCNGSDRPAFAAISSLAVTSTGDVIVADIRALSNSRVDRYSKTGALLATLSNVNTPVPNSFLTGANSNAVTVATNPATDEVFISSSQSWSITPVSASIYQFEGNTLVGSFSAPNNFSGYIHGIAARGEQPGRLYVLAASGFSPMVPRIQTYEAIVPASVTFGSVSSITPTSATFSGEINPNGTAAKWAFRYRLSGDTTWSQVPATPVDAGSGDTDVAVSQAVTGLEPNLNYEVRLVGFVGSVESTTESVTFKTASAAPSVDSGAASFVTDAGVRLYGNINPLNANVTYFFEWGTDDSYGNVTPDPAGNIAAARTASIVSTQLEDLEPGTEYRYRLVAENEFGQETLGSDRTFTTLAEPRPGLLGTRGFEMTTLLPTGGMGMLPGFSEVSEDGSRAIYHTAETEPAPPGGDLPHRQFVVERETDHWSVTAIDYPDISRINPFGIGKGSRDLSSSVVMSMVGIDPDDRNKPEFFTINNQREGMDLYRVVPGEEPVWLTRSRLVPPGEPQTDGALVQRPQATAMSVDGSVVAFLSNRRLLEDDPFASDQDYVSIDENARIYKWSRGELSVASVLPDGSVTKGYPSVGLMSRDGSRMAWGRADDNIGNGAKVYVQRDGAQTTDAGTGVFVAGTPDLSWLVVNDAGRLYSVDGDTGTRQEISGGATVRIVLRTSEDGRVVTFVSPTVVPAAQSPLGESPTQGRDNIYRAELDENGSLEGLLFIAAPPQGNLSANAAATDDHGSMFAFGSTAPLTGQPTGGGRQLFVYDNVSRSLKCVSCPRDGSTPHASDVNSEVNRGEVDTFSSWYAGGINERRYITSDGAVFFSTKTALAPGDENQSRDVYEYSGGELRLVSRGAWNDSASTFQGVGRDGVNAFIMTSAALDHRDNEPGIRKLYAMRVGGGFAHPDTPQAPCAGDDCQGPATDAPEGTASGSAAPRGQGNASPGVRKRLSVGTPSTAARRRAARDGMLAVRVRTTRPGLVRVLAQGRIGKRTRRVAGRTVHVRKAGAITVKLRLSQAASRVLQRGRTLTVALRVSSTGAQARTATVRLKRGGKS